MNKLVISLLLLAQAADARRRWKGDYTKGVALSGFDDEDEEIRWDDTEMEANMDNVIHDFEAQGLPKTILDYVATKKSDVAAAFLGWSAKYSPDIKSTVDLERIRKNFEEANDRILKNNRKA